MKMNNELTMTYTEKILAEFDKGFCYDRYTTEEGYKKAMYSRGQYATKALKDFLSTSIHQAVAEDRARVRGNLPEISVSALSLLLNDCANCGQVINRSFVDDLTCRIQDEYKQKIIASLDEPLKERTNYGNE